MLRVLISCGAQIPWRLPSRHTTPTPSSIHLPPPPPPQKKGKAQAKRAKRAAEDAEREARIQAELANLGETERMVEEEKLRRVLVPLGLYIRDIPSDGHCLFRSVEDQLEFTGDPAPVPYPELRKRCAAHMQAHPADFLPFLDLDEEGESAESGEEGVERPQRSEEQRFEAYCARMGGSAVWGGQLEVRALAQALQRRVGRIPRARVSRVWCFVFRSCFRVLFLPGL